MSAKSLRTVPLATPVILQVDLIEFPSTRDAITWVLFWVSSLFIFTLCLSGQAYVKKILIPVKHLVFTTTSQESAGRQKAYIISEYQCDKLRCMATKHLMRTIQAFFEGIRAGLDLDPQPPTEDYVIKPMSVEQHLRLASMTVKFEFDDATERLERTSKETKCNRYPNGAARRAPNQSLRHSAQ